MVPTIRGSFPALRIGFSPPPPSAVFSFALLCVALRCFASPCFTLLCFALLRFAFALRCFALPCFTLHLLSFALLCFALLCLAVLCGGPWRPLAVLGGPCRHLAAPGGPRADCKSASTVAAGLGSRRGLAFFYIFVLLLFKQETYGPWSFRGCFAMVDLETCLPPAALCLLLFVSLLLFHSLRKY